MRRSIGVGIIAPSSKVPSVELRLGVEHLCEAGFDVRLHPQCLKTHLFFAGDDESRAQAFFDYARDPELSVLWCARGGYGSARLLPILDRLAADKGAPPPGKLLVGFSDATALLEYVRTRWGWSALHAPMPGLRKFSVLSKNEWESLLSLVAGESTVSPWGKKRLKFAGARPANEVRGELVGGNLSVWNSLLATPYEIRAEGKIVFFEDVDEALYRLDRMVTQLLLAGSLRDARAIVLGNFQDCRDSVPQVLKSMPTAKARKRAIEAPRARELQPLRKILDERRVIPRIFGRLGEALSIPVAFGLPVGHGPEYFPLPLGAEYRLTPDGAFEITRWTREYP